MNRTWTKPRRTGAITSITLITSGASTLSNFRGTLIKTLVERGIKVVALAPDYDAETRQSVIALGATPIDISLDRTGMRPSRDVLSLFCLYRHLRRLAPDATFSYFVKPVIYGSLAAWRAGVPRRYAMVAGLGYVFTGNEPSDWRKRGLQKIVSLMYRAAFRVCTAVFFQNEEDRGHFIRSRAIEPYKAFRVSGSGVDLDYFPPAPPVVAPMTFLLMGRLLREKGIYEFVEAARLLQRSGQRARFVVLGGFDSNPGGISEAEMRAWVAERVIEWPGQVRDVRPWIAQSSVYVLPSYREGLPRSTQEAMAMARPVITTDSPGCRDTVEDGVNGYLVPVGDSEALARAMLRFIEQPSLVGSMGPESRRFAEERFDVRKVNAAILDVMGLATAV